jgi:hypothetical protein
MNRLQVLKKVKAGHKSWESAIIGLCNIISRINATDKEKKWFKFYLKIWRKTVVKDLRRSGISCSIYYWENVGYIGYKRRQRWLARHIILVAIGRAISFKWLFSNN